MNKDRTIATTAIIAGFLLAMFVPTYSHWHNVALIFGFFFVMFGVGIFHRLSSNN